MKYFRVSNQKTSRQIYFMYDINAISLKFFLYSIQTFDLYASTCLTDFKSKSPIILLCWHKKLFYSIHRTRVRYSGGPFLYFILIYTNKRPIKPTTNVVT